MDAYEHAAQAERSLTNEAVSRADLALARVGRGELDGARRCGFCHTSTTALPR
ncbi:MAG: hypothetical protein ACRDZ4_06385 [Egibacteraceae bacterium]